VRVWYDSAATWGWKHCEGSNRRIGKTARPVVWEGAGAQSPAPDPIVIVARPVEAFGQRERRRSAGVLARNTLDGVHNDVPEFRNSGVADGFMARADDVAFKPV